MKNDRLTDKNDSYWALQETKLSAEVGIYLTDCLNRLAELEDKIEQGTLIELPCKVGDMVYYVLDYGSVKGECVCVERGKVRAIEMRENYIWIEVLYEDFVSKHPLRNIGETVFLTREEAGKRLKELQNG